MTLQGNTHPLASPAYDRGPAPSSLRADRLLLLLQRSAQQEAALQTYLRSTQDPNSSNYHKWLTPSEFGQRFGISDADLANVQSWLVSQGFTIQGVSAGRAAIEFSGTVSQIQSAFHTQIHRYVVNGEQHWANATDPQIPSALAPVVAGFAALHDFAPHSLAIRAPSGIFRPQTQRIEPNLTYGNTTNGYMLFVSPADAATIYDVPTTLNARLSGTSYDGTGATIGVVGDSNIDTKQNDNYRATFGLPAKTTKVIVDGEDPGENGDAVEAYLDTQVASGIAPNASVVLYTAADTYLTPGVLLAATRAIDDNQVDILNVSFGECEADLGTSGNQFIYNLWQQAAAQGISITVSSGDSGSAGCDNQHSATSAQKGLAVNGFASTPYNIAVGGTDFDTLYSNFPGSFTQYVDVTNSNANHRSALGYIPEAPWNDSTVQGYNGLLANNIAWSVTNYPSLASIVATGGGPSTCVTLSGSTCGGGYPVPSWQSSFAVTNTARNLPDVSLLAGDGLYGAAWALCTDQDYINATTTQPDCVGTPSTGNSFNVTGVGGTSASAPAFAGMLALAVQKAGGRLGQADHVLYSLAKTKYASVFHDLAVGNNSVACLSNTLNCVSAAKGTMFLSGFNTGTGYDEASGLGSVDASQMLNYWGTTGATATTTSLTLNGSTSALTITHGDAVTVQASVSGSGGTPSGPVALVDNIDPATLPNSGAIQAFVLSSGAVNQSTHLLPGGSYNVSLHYGGDDSFAASDSNAIAVKVSPETSTTSLKLRGTYDPLTGNSSATPYYGYIYLIDAQPYGSSSSPSSPDGTATGTVTFRADSTTLGTAVLGSDGIAEYQATTISGGTHALTASFPGDASFQASTSASLSIAVQPAPSVLNITTDKSSYNAGDTVVLTATFASSSSSKYLDSMGAAPTGTVTFKDGTTVLGTATVTGTPGSATALAAASATFSAAHLAWGGHSFTASYNGDGNYASSAQANSTYVYLTGAMTKMAVTTAASTIRVDQPLAITVNLPVQGTLPVPTGTVVLSLVAQNTSQVWTSSALPVSNGSVSYTIPANSLPLGPMTLDAMYSGDSVYAGNSASSPVQVISSGTITPTLSVTLPTTPVSGSVPVTVAVSSLSGNPIPTGFVTITGSLMNYALVNGTVSFNWYGTLQPGSNTLTITYWGDSTYATTSASGSVIEKGPASISFKLASPTVNVTQPVNLTVSVAQVTGLPAPTGTITLTSGSYSSGVTPLVSGVASFTVPANTLPVGTDLLTATYSGDADYLAGSNGYSVTGTSAPIGLSVLGNNVNIAAGATTNNTSTVTVTPLGGFTGSVSLSANITQAPTGAVNEPTLSFGSSNVVTITGISGSAAVLTIKTVGPTTASVEKQKGLPVREYGAGGAALACVLLLMGPTQRRRGRTWLAIALLFVGTTLSVTACSGGSSAVSTGGGNSGTSPGTYSVTVTATSGALSASTILTVTVH